MPVYRPSPAFPAFLGVLIGYVGGWEGLLCGGRRLQPPAFIDTPLPQNRQFSSFRFSGFPFAPVPCPPAAAQTAAAQNDNGISFFIFSLFPKSLKPACAMALPYPTQRKLREITISCNYLRPVACNAVVSRLSSITWNCASIASIACGLSGGGSTMMVIGCGSLPCSGASAGVSR